jgi:hypothetical protein
MAPPTFLSRFPSPLIAVVPSILEAQWASKRSTRQHQVARAKRAEEGKRGCENPGW